MAQKNFQLLVTLVRTGQDVGLLAPASPDLVAVRLWSLVHGFIMLLLEGQISHTLLDRMSIRELLVFMVNDITQTEIAFEEIHPVAKKGFINS